MFFLSLRVIPRSSRDQFIREESGLKLKITAPPVDGEANKYIISVLSKTFEVPKANIKLVQGEKSKNKRFCLQGISEEDGIKRLESIFRE